MLKHLYYFYSLFTTKGLQRVGPLSPLIGQRAGPGLGISKARGPARGPSSWADWGKNLNNFQF